MFIYTLSDPITKDVRYIGKTNDIKKRFINHLKDKSKCHRTNWITSLKSKKLVPVINIIKECSEEDVDLLEKHYILEYKQLGYNLTNGTSGGDGGYIFTDEVKQKMSQQRKGKKQSIESIQKRAEKMCKPILQYTLTGEFVNQWESIKSAAEFYKVSETSIKQALSERTRKSANFQWVNYTENFSSNISPIRKIERPNKLKKVGLYDSNDNLIEIFPSVISASKKFNTSSPSICKKIKNNIKIKNNEQLRYI